MRVCVNLETKPALQLTPPLRPLSLMAPPRLQYSQVRVGGVLHGVGDGDDTTRPRSPALALFGGLTQALSKPELAKQE